MRHHTTDTPRKVSYYIRKGSNMRGRIINLLIVTVVWFIVTTPIHEFFHYQTAKLLGLKVWITYPDWFSGLCHFEGSSDAIWVAYIAGGIGTGVLMLLLAWRAVVSPTLWDESDAFILTVVGMAQIGYGIAELSYLYCPDYFIHCAAAGTVIGVAIAMKLRFMPLVYWIERGSDEARTT